VGRRPVVTALDPDLDPSALAAIGHEDVYRRSVAAKATKTAGMGLITSPTMTVVTSPLTTEGADLVRTTGATVAIATGPAWPEAVSGAIGTPPDRLAVVSLDARPLSSGDPPPDSGGEQAAAHRQLAHLAMLGPGGRPVLLGGQGAPGQETASYQADATVVDLLLDVLDDGAGVGSPPGVAPLFRALTLLDAAQSAATSDLAPAPTPAHDLTGVAADLDLAQGLLTTYDSFYVSGPGSPAEVRDRLAQALDNREQPGDQIATVTRVIDGLRAELGSISLPPNQSVTLAARRVSIPLTIENSSSGARNVKLEFLSDKFVVTEQGKVITVEPGISSIGIDVEARSLGEAPLRVTVLTPDRSHVLSTTRFRVRSTAVPNLGLAISAAGMVALAVWWFVSIRRKRAARAAPTPYDPNDPTDRSTAGIPDRSETLVADSVEP
jgi:hypothetical protein